MLHSKIYFFTIICKIHMNAKSFKTIAIKLSLKNFTEVLSIQKTLIEIYSKKVPRPL